MDQKIRIKGLIPTLLGCGAMLVVTLPKYHAVYLVFIVALLMPWFAYNFYRIVFRKSQRSLRLTKISIWLAGIIIVVVVNIYYISTSQKMSMAVLKKINTYQIKYNNYPENLEMLGIASEEYKEKYGIYYSNKNGEQNFGYFLPYMFLARKKYDFKKRQWELIAD